MYRGVWIENEYLKRPRRLQLKYLARGALFITVGWPHGSPAAPVLLLRQSVSKLHVLASYEISIHALKTSYIDSLYRLHIRNYKSWPLEVLRIVLGP